MATVALTTTPTQIDDGTSYTVLVTNTGATPVNLSRGGRLRPGQTATVYPEGTPLTAAATSGTGAVTTATTAKPLPNPSDPAALAARPEFTGTYAGINLRGPITPGVFAGDSITTTTGYLAYAGGAALGVYPVGAITAGGQATVDAGVGGNTSTQLLARFDTDVIARNPKIVHILIGTNDASAGASVATYAANVKAMVAKCRAIGARIVLGTVPPNGTGTPTNRKALIVAYNQWLCRYAIANQIPVADYYRVLVDTATGGYQSAYDSGDATHPSAAGTGVMATELKAALSRPNTSDLLLTKDANDPCNWTRNALFLSAFGTGWNNPVLTGGTASTVSGDATIQGNWGKLAAVATAGTFASSQNQTTSQGGDAYVIGNRFMLACRIQASAMSAAQTLSARLRHVNIGTSDHSTKALRFAYTGNGGMVFMVEGNSPALATAVQSEFEIAAGTGDIQIAQFTTYDLTAMGVTDTLGNLI